MDVIFCNTEEAKEKYSVSKKSNKLSNQLDVTLKEVNIKYESIEVIKKT